ncbi:MULTISPECIES: histidine kinase [unclassified Streptomyces]|uniref:sensor histidine kinase n=1 Tax=unclassified Streptomyces TaxID=2593676 RepID=UPI000F4F0376|nr:MULTISPECIES: histidine kinase [unclassified Streptomyces]MDH6452926.1 signal transduction histidine kinase [Streptomyces sp. SAI-119]MDH6496514.1 signal transduction histidine kinase [Streptomyces sp. SAI-149]QUC56684.1 two-component sensor histidine kinase [Streptomyces sp. A2-16]
MALPRPHRFDVYIAAGGLLGGLLLVGIGLGTRPSSDPMTLFDGPWPVLVPLTVLAGCELLRRTAPRAALLTGTAAICADLVTQGNLATVLMFTDVVYAAVLYGPLASARRIQWITGLLTVAATLVPFAVWRVPEALLIGVVVGVVAYAPASTGWIVRNHRDAAEAARLRAEQTALLAEMDRTQAVTAERARMARELHDMVANHLSAIAIHSTAALSIDDPATSREALSVIRENSVDGLAEMRRLIGILRDGDHEPAAVPTLDGLTALVDGARANGLDVTLDACHHGTVPAPVELAAYRIVQESLTNALKHACPGPVTVTLGRRDGALTVAVRSPYGDRDGPRAPGSGAGLVGMGERAALLGGTFDAGPDGRFWTVRATLPLDEGAPE